MKRIFFFLLSFFTIATIFSQKENDSIRSKSDFWKKVHFGGGFQLSFGSAYTTIGVSPSAIYSINDHWAAGIGTSYTYSKFKSSDLKYNIFGGSALVIFQPIKEVQLHSEFEQLWVNTNSQFTPDYQVPAWYVGAGYAIGRFGSVGLRYDLLWKENKSIYNSALSPYFKIYF